MSDPSARPKGLSIRPYRPSDEAAVVALWERCDLVRPQNDPYRDIARKARTAPELFLVGAKSGRVIATVMAGYEGHRGWINYLAVEPDARRGGVARAMMAQAERRLRALGCPKINLQIRRTNAAVQEFYRAIGYSVDDVISMGKRLEPDVSGAGPSRAGLTSGSARRAGRARGAAGP